jgi:signal transduction histidine kinase/YHS domain-containing protein
VNHVFEIFCTLCILLIASNAWFLWRVMRPLKRLSLQAVDLTTGNLEALEQPCGGIDEIDSLRRSMAGMVGHVRRAQEQSHVYTNVLTRAQEAERTRIARELHDDTIQSLVAVAQSIEMSGNWLGESSEQAATMLQATRQQVVETINDLRNLIADLRPPALEELGLIPALKMQAEKIPDLTVKVTVEGAEHRLDDLRELTLFRCAQESLNNAHLHSQASEVEVLVNYGCHGVALTVIDNGIGFTPPDTLDDLVTAGHYGLMGMQERVQALDGQMTINSAVGNGTTITLQLPQDCKPQPEKTVRDPVCSAVIEPQQAYGSVEHDGVRHYFCCPVCQGAFQKNPQMYLQS